MQEHFQRGVSSTDGPEVGAASAIASAAAAAHFVVVIVVVIVLVIFLSVVLFLRPNSMENFVVQKICLKVENGSLNGRASEWVSVQCS